MVRVFLDTNILLDIALRRVGLVEGSERAVAKCTASRYPTFVSWHTLSNLFYILRRERGAAEAIRLVRAFLSTSTVATVGHEDALYALEYGLSDFEDALQLSAAESCSADVLLTRNTGHFGKMSKIAIMTPEEFAPLPPVERVA